MDRKQLDGWRLTVFVVSIALPLMVAAAFLALALTGGFSIPGNQG